MKVILAVLSALVVVGSTRYCKPDPHLITDLPCTLKTELIKNLRERD